MDKYDTSSIELVDAITHIRKHTSLYLGDTSNATQLLIEMLDNSLDEVAAGGAKRIKIEIGDDYFSVEDDGRGIPFDGKLPLDKDPPILITHEINTSGKFRKNENGSSYKISVGLHGIGLTAVSALSNKMLIDIYRDNKHGLYTILHDGTAERKISRGNKKPPYSTKMVCYPNPIYFDDISVNMDQIIGRLSIASARFPRLKLYINDDKISCTEEDLFKTYLGEAPEYYNTYVEKKHESCTLTFAWAECDSPKQTIFTTVNLAPVLSGPHITKINNFIKAAFEKLKKKYNYSFEPSDCLNWSRIYINLMVVKNHFDSQTKERLSKKSDLSIMDGLEKQIEVTIKAMGEEELKNLLIRFQDYRKAIQSKKLTKTHGKKRGSSRSTKLQDCTSNNGELIIGEGASAIGGLAQVRDEVKHAVLALRGVIPNILTKKDALDNQEVKEIIRALGCGIGSSCDISKLRYGKVIIAADADPAGYFITALLIILFASLVPDLIKENKLFICKTPLFGIKKKGKFVPLWTNKDLEKARKNKESIIRIKGLGEFDPDDLKVFTLDESTRILIPVTWSKNYKAIFKLMSDAKERRKLVLNTWKIED